MSFPLASSALETYLALFPLTNPLGAIPIFYALVKPESYYRRGRLALQIALKAMVVLTVFLLVGRLILSFLGISLDVLRIAGGLLIAQTAWQMLTRRQELKKESSSFGGLEADISLIPMAIPIISGPGAIGMTITLAMQNSNWLEYLGNLLGIGLLGITLYLFLTLGGSVVKAIGKSGLSAFNQVLGFFILAVAIQLIADGVLTLLPLS
ncbi:MAG: MarC family protein [Microcystaceae cyanobacterium]